MRDQLIQRIIHEEEPRIWPGILDTSTDEPTHEERTMICSTAVTWTCPFIDSTGESPFIH